MVCSGAAVVDVKALFSATTALCKWQDQINKIDDTIISYAVLNLKLSKDTVIRGGAYNSPCEYLNR